MLNQTPNTKAKEKDDFTTSDPLSPVGGGGDGGSVTGDGAGVSAGDGPGVGDGVGSTTGPGVGAGVSTGGSVIGGSVTGWSVTGGGVTGAGEIGAGVVRILGAELGLSVAFADGDEEGAGVVGTSPTRRAVMLPKVFVTYKTVPSLVRAISPMTETPISNVHSSSISSKSA